MFGASWTRGPASCVSRDTFPFVSTTEEEAALKEFGTSYRDPLESDEDGCELRAPFLKAVGHFRGEIWRESCLLLSVRRKHRCALHLFALTSTIPLLACSRVP